MTFGSGAAHNIYSGSCTLLPSSFQPYISLVRRWDEVWRRFVEVAESGLASRATGIAGEMVATGRVIQFNSPGLNNFSCVEAPVINTRMQLPFSLLQGHL